MADEKNRHDDADKPEKSFKPDFALVEADVKRAQNFVVAAASFGLFALLMGSLLLGVIGLVLGIMGLRRTNALTVNDFLSERTVKKMRIVAYCAIGMSVLAIVISVVYLAIAIPYYWELAQSGELEALLEEYAASTSTSTNSTWG